MDSIEYYNKYAAKIYEDTVDVDMSEILNKFLSLLNEGDTILDLGCGSGRDSKTMYDLGYDVSRDPYRFRCTPDEFRRHGV